MRAGQMMDLASEGLAALYTPENKNENGQFCVS